MVLTASNVLISDAYNANPSSMSAALDNFNAINADKKIALLGDMRELGEDSVNEHIKVIEKLLAYNLDACLVGDEFKKAVLKIGTDKFRLFTSSEDLAAFIGNNPFKNTLVLVKGSRGIQMEKTFPVL